PVVHQDTELSLVALQNRWCDQAVDRQSLCGSHQALPIEGAAYHFVQRHLLAPRAFDSRYVSASELQQVLDQALQLHDAVAQDVCDLPLLGIQTACTVIQQQLRALAQGRERRLELMGDVAQERALLLFELE